jgi:hypothetical protein
MRDDARRSVAIAAGDGPRRDERADGIKAASPREGMASGGRWSF